MVEDEPEGYVESLAAVAEAAMRSLKTSYGVQSARLRAIERNQARLLSLAKQHEVDPSDGRVAPAPAPAPAPSASGDYAKA